MSKRNEKGEIMELGHDPVPGYLPVFLVCITAGLLYMAYIFAKTF